MKLLRNKKAIAITIIIIYILMMVSLIMLIIKRENGSNGFFSDFGHKPLCNRREDRALTINGFVFPLCYRCMAITFSCFLTMIILIIKQIDFNFNKRIIVLLLILISITFLDGVLQYIFSIESNNARRMITGIISGTSIGVFFYYFYNLLNKTTNN